MRDAPLAQEYWKDPPDPIHSVNVFGCTSSSRMYDIIVDVSSSDI
jgi:hypothetical protein